MKKTEVYSWRVASDRKTALENEARREGTTVAALLDHITQEWLEAKRGVTGDEAEQARLHARAGKAIGAIAGKALFRRESLERFAVIPGNATQNGPEPQRAGFILESTFDIIADQPVGSGVIDKPFSVPAR